MTSDSERDDSSGKRPASEPEPKLDPKKPVTPDSKPWQKEPAADEPESGESG
jgi:hypothetical protein